MEPEGSELTHPRQQEANPLRIVIDGRKLGDGGIGVYIENLVRGLIEIGGVELTLIARPVTRDGVEYAADVRWIFEESPNYSIDELFFLGRRLKLSNYDLFHAPHYTLPFGISIPSIVTVHDLIHVQCPERFYYPWIARHLISSAVRRATAVIAVSHHTRRAVLDLCGVPDSKVVCIPNGVASFLRDSEGHAEAGARFAEFSPFFLSIFSTIKPHKGLLDLIEAYRAYRAVDTWSELGLQRCPQLVLAGYGTEEILRSSELLSVINQIEGIHIIGQVSRDELAALYRKAAVVVVPSLLEGFCLPALEAQACGTPVVCRPVPALQELVIETDEVASDYSAAALTVAMVRGMIQGVTGQRMPPLKHLEAYSYIRTASKVSDLYRRALSLGGVV